MKHERLIVAGVLISGMIALFASSASAEPAAAAGGPLFDPGLGLPRTQTQRRLTVGSLSKPVDVYEWGPNSSPNARLLVDSDDPTAFVAFVPPSVGSVQTILARGTGPMTAELVAFVLGKGTA